MGNNKPKSGSNVPRKTRVRKEDDKRTCTELLNEEWRAIRMKRQGYKGRDGYEILARRVNLPEKKQKQRRVMQDMKTGTK